MVGVPIADWAPTNEGLLLQILSLVHSCGKNGPSVSGVRTTAQFFRKKMWTEYDRLVRDSVTQFSKRLNDCGPSLLVSRTREISHIT